MVVTGMGKSGIIARKIAATLSSTGTPSLFMHPVDAVHGDLGMVVRGDVVLALSASGETEEILRLLATLKRLQVPLISMTGDAVFEQKPRAGRPRPHKHNAKNIYVGGGGGCCSRLLGGQGSLRAGAGAHGFDHGYARSGRCAGDDAGREARIQGRRFCQSASRRKTGQALARVESLMHTGEAVPRVTPQTRMPDVIYEMSRKKLGVTAVVDGEKLVGVISDGDLRRLLEKRGKDVLDLTAAECMTAKPRTIGANEFAATALALMEEKKITSLVVVDDADKLLGIVHLHDLWGTEMM